MSNSNVFNSGRFLSTMSYERTARRPSMFTAKYRFREERKKVLKVSIGKVRHMDDPESFLRRSVLINNTIKRLQREVRDEKMQTGSGTMTSVSASFLRSDETFVDVSTEVTTRESILLRGTMLIATRDRDKGSNEGNDLFYKGLKRMHQGSTTSTTSSVVEVSPVKKLKSMSSTLLDKLDNSFLTENIPTCSSDDDCEVTNCDMVEFTASTPSCPVSPLTSKLDQDIENLLCSSSPTSLLEDAVSSLDCSTDDISSTVNDDISITNQDASLLTLTSSGASSDLTVHHFDASSDCDEEWTRASVAMSFSSKCVRSTGAPTIGNSFSRFLVCTEKQDEHESLSSSSETKENEDTTMSPMSTMSTSTTVLSKQDSVTESPDCCQFETDAFSCIHHNHHCSVFGEIQSTFNQSNNSVFMAVSPIMESN